MASDLSTEYLEKLLEEATCVENANWPSAQKAIACERLCDMSIDLARELLRLRKEAEWVRVEERLPSVGKQYLVMGAGRQVVATWCDGWYEFASAATVEGVTHWRPLPAPPLAPEKGDKG